MYLDILKAIVGVYIMLIGFNVFKKFKNDIEKQKETSDLKKQSVFTLEPVELMLMK